VSNDCFEIYVARHGQSYGNLRRRQGIDSSVLAIPEREDPALTDAGKQQAHLLGELLKNIKFDAIYSSPLLRAAGTAYEVLLSQQEKSDIDTIYLLDELIEVNVLEGYLGRGLDFLKEQFPKANFVHEQSPEHPVPRKGEGDDMRVSVHRAKCAIDFIRSKYTYGKKVFIATHGTYLTSFMYAALGISPETSRFRFGCENSSFNRIMYYTDGKILLEAANDISHLRLWGDDLIPQARSLFIQNE